MQHLVGTSGALAGALFLSVTTHSGYAETRSRPNIVLILADDVSADMFSCYGETGAARTPNVDRIAKEGVLFRTCYAPAICAPSRALLMTGTYANRSGVYHNGIWMNDSRGELFVNQASWAVLLRRAGYATAIAGKWHCGAKMPWEEDVGFDEYCLWEGPDKISAHIGTDVYAEGLRERVEQTDDRYWHPSTIRNGKYVRVKTSDFGPDIRCRFILEFMERNARARQPFVAYWPTVIPHGPYSTTPEVGDVMDIELSKPDTTGLRGEDRNRAMQAYDLKQQQRFVNLVQYIDTLTGKLMQKAEDLGIDDNTYFIFCSDNGTAVTAKNRGVERGCHVAYAIKGPRVTRRGPTDELTDFADIAPTLLDIAGVSAPTDVPLHGRSQMPYLSGKTETHREWIYSYIGTTQLLRTKSHLLEALNPMFDMPRGRFYFCGSDRFGRTYVRVDQDPEHAAERKRFDEILRAFPPLLSNNRFWQSKKGAGWLKSNATPEAIARHLHNHPDYRVYDED